MSLVAVLALAGALAAGSTGLPWTHSYDFDGDGKNDRVEPEHTGGAHCCYRITVHLTSTGKPHRLPFRLDGGYVGGLDLSQPDRFNIVQTEGSLPELVMEIETYNGEPRPLPRSWKRRYGVTSHRIAVSFPCGRPRARSIQ